MDTIVGKGANLSPTKRYSNMGLMERLPQGKLHKPLLKLLVTYRHAVWRTTPTSCFRHSLGPGVIISVFGSNITSVLVADCGRVHAKSAANSFYDFSFRVPRFCIPRKGGTFMQRLNVLYCLILSYLAVRNKHFSVGRGCRRVKPHPFRNSFNYSDLKK